MTVCAEVSFDELIEDAAARAGLRRTRGGGWKTRAGRGAVTLNVRRLPDGWLAFECAGRRAPSDEQLLREQAAWLGPVKLQRTPDAAEVRRVVELPLPDAQRTFPSVSGHELAESLEKELVEFFSDLFRWATRCLGGSEVHTWEETVPLQMDRLANWLREGGYSPTYVSDSEVRLVLKRKGWDGDVRFCAGEGRLRAVMSLGFWPQLSRVSRHAMIALAMEANDRCRLCRIAIPPEANVDGQNQGGDHSEEYGRGATRRREHTLALEAQFDLTGLPPITADQPVRSAFGRELLTAIVDAFRLNLCRLAVELDVLAHNQELAGSILRHEGAEKPGAP
ncbi:MAG: hypothetical protein GXP27_17560 [Planctomycetes bacterium]|nr:hypothetical protein [Planctomycetota bacterium]